MNINLIIEEVDRTKRIGREILPNLKPDDPHADQMIEIRRYRVTGTGLLFCVLVGPEGLQPPSPDHLDAEIRNQFLTFLRFIFGSEEVGGDPQGVEKIHLKIAAFALNEAKDGFQTTTDQIVLEKIDTLLSWLYDPAHQPRYVTPDGSGGIRIEYEGHNREFTLKITPSDDFLSAYIYFTDAEDVADGLVYDLTPEIVKGWIAWICGAQRPPLGMGIIQYQETGVHEVEQGLIPIPEEVFRNCLRHAEADEDKYSEKCKWLRDLLENK